MLHNVNFLCNYKKISIPSIKKQWPKAHITAIGTNSLATAAMLKAAPSEAATGENPVVVCAPRADVIIGPIGILVADALLGEVTPRMAVAVGQSPAETCRTFFRERGGETGESAFVCP